jgi:hypothetical protein
MMRLEPFDAPNAVSLLRQRGFDTTDALEAYFILGGVPKYLVDITPGEDLLSKHFFGSNATLREEGKNILIMEFGSEHKGYFSILESVSEGKVTPTEIADHTGLDISAVGKYLGELLEEYEFVAAERPATVDNRKLVRYRIRDNFFNFWFQFIHSRTSLIEIDRGRALQETKERIGGLYGKQAEEMVRGLVIADGQLIHPTEAGRWWDRMGNEIDLMAVDEKTETSLFCEVKWTNRKIGWDIVEDLKRKAGLVQWRLPRRKERFLLVSRSGFTESCHAKMEEEGILHWDMKEVEKRLKANSD